MMSLTRLAESRGYHRAAVALDGEVLVLAAPVDRADQAIEAISGRARMRLDAGDERGAAADLAAARDVWLPHLSPSDRAWFIVDLLRIDGELQRRTDPAHGRALLDSALRLLGDEQNEVRGSTIRLSHAQAVLSTGDTSAALAEMNAVLTTLVGRGAGGMTVFDRARLATVTREAALESARALRARGDAARALRALSGKPFLTPDGLVSCCADAKTTRLAMRAVGDSVWVWSTLKGFVRLDVVPLAARHLSASTTLDSTALGTLYDVLIRPFAAFPADGDRTLQLDVRGALAAVPWSALRDRGKRQYLIEQTAVRLIDTDMAAPPRASRQLSAPLRVALIDAAPRTGAQALAGAAREIAVLDSIWHEQAHIVDATRGAAYTLARLGDVSIVHFAGHAILDAARPDRSYLSLPATRDSTIRSVQLTRKTFGHVSLVILAACETRGAPGGSQGGFDSLAGAMLDAGAETVIGAQWAVDDAATATLMRTLHAGLRAGRSPEQALRGAQVAALRQDARALMTPGVWAAFVALGR